MCILSHSRNQMSDLGRRCPLHVLRLSSIVYLLRSHKFMTYASVKLIYYFFIILCTTNINVPLVPLRNSDALLKQLSSIKTASRKFSTKPP